MCLFRDVLAGVSGHEERGRDFFFLRACHLYIMFPVPRAFCRFWQ